ncbi:hypothetical protein BgiBS90_026690, partial [Biomphalaria glabrata]
ILKVTFKIALCFSMSPKSTVAQTRGLEFASCHGSNVRLHRNRNLALAHYEKAHGQFILSHELSPGQSFVLNISGTGLLKIGGFNTKAQAEDWVRSKRQLAEGSIRIRLGKVLTYRVSVPFEREEILLSTVTTKEERQDKLIGKILAFDIEYGDLVVIISEHNTGTVELDSTCHSPHIYVNNSPRLSHANLNTYNPTSLCTLDSCVIKAGDVYKLEVNGLVDSEAYVRVCVSKRYSEYINGPETLEGAKNLPEFRGKRFMIKPSAQEVFILRVEEDNIAIQRNNKQICSLKAPLSRGHFGLWFEMHEVALKVSSVRVKCNLKNQNDANNGPPPPAYPAPLPPHYRRILDGNNNSGGVDWNDPLGSLATRHHYLSLHDEVRISAPLFGADNFQHPPNLVTEETDSQLSRETNNAYYSSIETKNNLSMASPFQTSSPITFNSAKSHPMYNISASNSDIHSLGHEQLAHQHFSRRSDESGSSFWISYNPGSCSHLPLSLFSTIRNTEQMSPAPSMLSEDTFGLGENLLRNSSFQRNAFSDSDAMGVTGYRPTPWRRMSTTSDDNSDSVSQYSELTIDVNTSVKRLVVKSM